MCFYCPDVLVDKIKYKGVLRGHKIVASGELEIDNLVVGLQFARRVRFPYYSPLKCCVLTL